MLWTENEYEIFSHTSIIKLFMAQSELSALPVGYIYKTEYSFCRVYSQNSSWRVADKNVDKTFFILYF